MGIKQIHVVLIAGSILLFIALGVWSIHHNQMIAGLFSFSLASALIIYCINFLKKLKAF